MTSLEWERSVEANFPISMWKGPEIHRLAGFSAEDQQIVKDFGKDKYGEPLFFPNSPEGKRL